MSSAAFCPQCNASLPTGMLHGLCLHCLARHAGHILAARKQEDAPAGSLRLRYFGDYELLEEIARGGMGVVWKARQISLNRIVAVKLLLAGKFSSPEFVQRFRTEAEAAAILQHPNIVAVHEVGEHDAHQYLSMDYVEGQNLFQLAREQPVSARRAATLLKTIAEAVHYAHQRGVLHRDLKPANILIDASNEPRVTDFGLAKRFTSDSSFDLTLTGQILGTPAYTSPEQAGGKRGVTGFPSDVYSLGAVLYFLLTGRAPFVADTLEETLRQVHELDPISPRIFSPAISRDLETICLKCLSKEPAHRYDSAKALAEDLGRFLNGEPIRARPASQPEKLWRWCRRKPALAVLLTALVLVGAVGLAGILWQWSLAKQSAQEARLAQRETTTNLWNAYLAQARANRFSGRFGRRFESLDALAKASAIRPSTELRDEAIAALALSDVRLLKSVATNLPEWTASVADEDLKRYAIAYLNGEISVHRMADDVELLRLLPDRTKRWKPPSAGARQWLAFSHDGQLLAARRPDKMVRVWNLATHSAIETGPCTDFSEGFGLDFSPDDHVLALADETDQVRIYNPADGRIVRTLTAPNRVHLVRFSPDGRCLAVCSSQAGGIYFLDAVSGEVLADRRVDYVVNSLTWHPEGSLVVTDHANARQVQVWAWQNGQVLHTFLRHTEQSFCRAFHPKSDLLFSAGYDAIHVWNYRSGEYVLRIPEKVQSLCFSPDGTRLFARYTHHAEFRYLEVAVDDPIRRFTPDQKASATGWAAAFSPGGELFMQATQDRSLVVHDGKTGRALAEIETGFIKGLAFDARSNLWTSGTNALTPGLTRWPLRLDVASNRWTFGPPEIVDRRNADGALPWAGPVDVSRDGHTLAYTAQSRCFVGDPFAPASVRPMARGSLNWDYLKLSPDGSLLATGKWGDIGVKIWDTASGKQLHVLGGGADGSPGGCMEFSGDGQWLSVSTRRDISVWRTRDWKKVWKIAKTDDAGTHAISPDSQLLVVRYNNSLLRFLAIESGQVLASFDLPNGQPIGGLHFTADGSRLALRSTLTLDFFTIEMRQLRARLAAMGLDWDRPPYPTETALQTRITPQMTVILERPATEAK